MVPENLTHALYSIMKIVSYPLMGCPSDATCFKGFWQVKKNTGYIFLAINGISNFVHKIIQSMGSRVATMKTESMLK